MYILNITYECDLEYNWRVMSFDRTLIIIMFKCICTVYNQREFLY